MEPMADSRPNSPIRTAPLEQTVVVGLGANLGDRAATLQQAVTLIDRRAPVVRLSPLYESAPVGGPPQGAFFNAAVAVTFAEPLNALLRELQQIEIELGRVREERWGPRSIDLDILWAADRTCATSSLTVPHPELTKRSFALGPLLDIFPSAFDPRDHTAYASILCGLEHQRMTRIDDQNWWKRSLG